VNCWKLLKLYLPQRDAQAWMRRFEKDKDSHSYKKESLEWTISSQDA
jgi:hypothetical protein